MAPTAPAGETAVYGGSFNPPHVGHHLAVAYLRAVGFDEVVVVPVHSHAFAKDLAPFEDRVAMCEASLGSLPGVTVSRIEATLPTPSYTLHTLKALLAEAPRRRLRLVVGADVLGETHKWHAFHEVVRLAPLFPLGRVGVEHPNAPVAVLPEVSSSEVRRWVASGDAAEKLRALVPSAVVAHIEAAGLYSSR